MKQRPGIKLLSVVSSALSTNVQVCIWFCRSRAGLSRGFVALLRTALVRFLALSAGDAARPATPGRFAYCKSR